MDNGLGHLHGTSLPVGGESTHSVITGHTGVADKALFTRLTELRKGDVFYVKVAAQTLAYKVTRIRKVDPDDLRSVRIQPGRDLVTLVTCTPIFLNTYRLLVTGERVSMPDDAPYPEDAPRTSGRDTRPYLVSGVTCSRDCRPRRRSQAENPAVRTTRAEGLTRPAMSGVIWSVCGHTTADRTTCR